MVTLNQVIKNLNSIADAHYQIKSFGSGDVQEFATSGVTNYPAMWVGYENSRVEGRAYVHVLRVYIADRLIKGKKNELDVLSDVQQVCLDTKNGPIPLTNEPDNTAQSPSCPYAYQESCDRAYKSE